ncbi:MAG: ankyrin repeat domain-containing protein [Parachlamydia sp.]|nr:ankyrin repeat domain-containing protein [Parachlamydia sp.]
MDPGALSPSDRPPVDPIELSQQKAEKRHRTQALQAAGGSAPITSIPPDLLKLILSYLSEDERPAPREIASWFRDNIAEPPKLKGAPDNPIQLKAAKVSERVLGAAVRSGAIPFLEWAKARHVPIGEYVTNEAALAGKLDVLKWAVKNQLPINLENCAYCAIQNGHLDVLQWLQKEKGYQLQEHDMKDAVTFGQLEVLQWLVDQLKDQGFSLGITHFNLAVVKGFLPVMEWLHKQGCPWDEDVCRIAADNGQVEALRWLRAHGCPWNERTCLNALAPNTVPTLEWAINNGAPFIRQDLLNMASPEAKLWLEENTVAYTPKLVVDTPKPVVDTPKKELTQEQKAEIDKRSKDFAKVTAELEKSLTVEDLQRLVAHLPQSVSANLPPHSSQFYLSNLMSELARYGSVHILNWMMERNFPPPKTWFCTPTAAQGNLEALKWARAHDYPWEDTMAVAALNGRLELLQWAIANGCPWDKRVCGAAAEAGHFNLLKWALANGAPYDREQLIRSAATHPKMREWLEVNLPRAKQP